MLLAVALVVTVLAYSPGFSAPFIFDDDLSIQKNPTIRTLDPSVALRPPGGDHAVSGRPLVNYSFALNYALNASLGIDQRADPDGPTKTVSYHLVNLFLHLGVGCLVFALVRRTLRRGRFRDAPNVADNVAVAVTSIWLIHPIHTEAVLYTVQRTEILGSLLCVAALYASVRAWDAGGARARFAWRVVGIACCVAGVASKEIAVVIPVLVMLYDRAFHVRGWRELVRRSTAPIGYYATLAAVCVAAFGLQRASGVRATTVGFGHGIAWYEYLYTQGWAIGRYLQLSLVPLGLTLDYGDETVKGLAAIPGLAVLVVLGIVTLLAWTRAERWGWLAFLGSWFFVLLAPSSSIVPIASEIAAERRVYLALVAVIVVSVLFVRARLAVSGRIGFFASATVFALFATLTYRRSAQYATPEQLWRESIERAPGNARAYTSLAYTLLHEAPPRTDEAIPQLERAIALDSSSVSPLRSLAAIALSKGQLPVARDLLQRAYALDPNYADVAPLLGIVLTATGEYDKAAQYLADPKIDRLAENDPTGSLVLALGNAYMSLGRVDPALTVFSRAVEIWPNRADFRISAGDALLRLGRPSDAERQLREALRLQPEDAQAATGLAIALEGLGKRAEAIAVLDRVLASTPDYEPARSALDAIRNEGGTPAKSSRRPAR